ncbi:MAG: LysR family transcriptional regulator [Myxococcota bacterium]|nr:LysR family transcriptional regulator [Myxococcota bacterium]
MSLNYQHLRYFWMVAREKNISRASEKLLLAPSTVSTQIKTLEARLGYPLFERQGRGLVLTVRGQVVKEYADDIFALGEELVDAARSKTGLRHTYRLRVGVGNHLPKLIALELLYPALNVPDFPVHLMVREGLADQLVADLAVHHLDLVLVDRPVGLSLDVHAESILIGESSISLMAAPKLAAQALNGFPNSLNGMPMILPEVGSAMRNQLEIWFQKTGVHPRIVAEFGDSALLKSFGQAGVGIFAVPTTVRGVVESTYRVVTIQELSEIRESLYAIIMPTRKENPAVMRILEAAEYSI